MKEYSINQALKVLTDFYPKAIKGKFIKTFQLLVIELLSFKASCAQLMKKELFHTPCVKLMPYISLRQTEIGME